MSYMIPKHEKYTSMMVSKSKNMLVPHYLMASYAYYQEDNPIYSDAYFDNMAKVLLRNYDDIEHIHKEHISKGDLEAGSFLGKYPSRIPGALANMRQAVGKMKI